MAEKFKQFGRLPGRPSELIRLALKDLAAVEANSEEFFVDMSDWVRPDTDLGKCAVCLAGAVMVERLDCRPSRYYSPTQFEEEHALRALNNLRQGDVDSAFYHLDLSVSEGRKYTRELISYKLGHRLFRKQMNQLADDLEAGGY